MVKLLSQPYPVEESTRQRLLRAVYIGAFVGVFLLLFQPFGLAMWQTSYKTGKILGFGLITFLLTAFNYTVWARLFPQQFSDRQWTVGREIAFVIVHILTISIANRLYLAWLIGDMAGLTDLTSVAFITFLVGIFPTAGSILFNYIVQLRKYSQGATELSVHSTASTPVARSSTNLKTAGSDSGLTSPPTTLTLVADNEKDSLTFPPVDLLYVESSDNYCTVVYLTDAQPVKRLLRSSLGRLEGQINQPHIVRCHRSYVVNLDRVERITGNAQGYKLHLCGGQFQIPVARKYNDTLVAELKVL